MSKPIVKRQYQWVARHMITKETIAQQMLKWDELFLKFGHIRGAIVLLFRGFFWSLSLKLRYTWLLIVTISSPFRMPFIFILILPMQCLVKAFNNPRNWTGWGVTSLPHASLQLACGYLICHFHFEHEKGKRKKRDKAWVTPHSFICF